MIEIIHKIGYNDDKNFLNQKKRMEVQHKRGASIKRKRLAIAAVFALETILLWMDGELKT
jgi:hypothetical protein